eukprot:1141788-Pelagomonas_calceolata.AAC.1
MYANKLVTTRSAIESKNTSRSQVMESGASDNPPNPYLDLIFVASWWRGPTALLSRCVSFSLIDVGRVSSAYVVFLFFSIPHSWRTLQEGVHVFTRLTMIRPSVKKCDC